jgi:glutamate-1-semialdehyde 2,1-aminomutase
VIACGYFGWLDWCSEDAAGVPADTQRLTRRVPYDDVAALTAQSAKWARPRRSWSSR